MELFNQLDPTLKTFWIIAIAASLVFVIQTILTFVGADAADGIEADFEGDLSGADAPFQLFSLRNLTNFLLGFSWSGIAFYNTIGNVFLLVAICVLVGALFVFAFFIIIQQVQKLAEDNSFKLTDTLNKTAEVYLTIPANKAGKGKVMVSVRGAFHELDAITENHAAITTGSLVKVSALDNNLLVVNPI